MELIVHINQDGVRRGISPVASGSSVHTQVMKTEGLRQALDAGGFDAAFGGARRDEEKSRAKERIFSHRSATPRLGPPQPAAGTLAPLQHAHQAGRVDAGLSRCPTGPSSTCGTTSGPKTSRSCRSISPSRGLSCDRGGTLIMVDDDRLPLEPGETPDRAGAVPYARLLSADRGRPFASRDARRDPGEMRASTTSERQGRLIDSDEFGLDGKEEARGIFLMASDRFTTALCSARPCGS